MPALRLIEAWGGGGMGTRDTHLKTLMRACVLVGGEAELARKLEAPEWRVKQWLSGEAAMPETVFLQAVDMVHALSPQQASSEERKPP